MHQRQSDLSRDGVWLCVVSISFPSSSNPWYPLEGQEGLAFKVICPQGVVVQNCHRQAGPRSLALIQGHQTVIQRGRGAEGGDKGECQKHLESEWLRRLTCESDIEYW